MSALAGPCACHNPGVTLPLDHNSPDNEDYNTHRMNMEYSMLTTSEDQAVPPPRRIPKTKQEDFALKIDRFEQKLSK